MFVFSTFCSFYGRAGVHRFLSVFLRLVSFDLPCGFFCIVVSFKHSPFFHSYDLEENGYESCEIRIKILKSLNFMNLNNRTKPFRLLSADSAVIFTDSKRLYKSIEIV